ncbi:MAG: UDP-N-acetylenolpyruvoylglucosamine reductase [Candidatus Harrisonbacteria bacterium RIFCSPLOWO2_01_FULL_40_28]|uniref:UDP-N-acetylenolpyruvoylglucosamine reductase n=1 Tax=Candidatus Harrisonbacteria bacterium RIFCSPLOWO2_01_FULL_40_28 TaxID=1798406 RepID=A0A1G1ZK57_9BACT|nr:MAG: UDP-N-acetylenolpyruvoylglucosamine reductase [Candidatus Harrisonbacteria bacterium RIFCSPLOWO2_01_FULL_40_28]
MIKENISLKQFSHYKIGGPARYFYDAKNREEIKDALVKRRTLNLPLFILGGGTNLLISDEGFSGIVLRPNMDYIKQVDETTLHVGAGTSVHDLLMYLIKNKLSGMEWAGGLPGTVGGAVRGNAGAFGGEIKDVVYHAISIDSDKEEGVFVERDNKECRFGYRTSIFKGEANNEIIIEVTLLLKKGKKEDIEKMIQEKINYRIERHPMDYPNIGSIFKNVDVNLFTREYLEPVKDRIKKDPFPVVPTAVLISLCGLAGAVHGGAMISPKHPNFIINTGNASSRDVEYLIAFIKREVYKKFHVNLEEEIVRVS